MSTRAAAAGESSTEVLRAPAPALPAADSPAAAAACASSSEAFTESRASIYPRGGRHGPRHRADTLEVEFSGVPSGAKTLALYCVLWSALLGLALPLVGLGPPLHLSLRRDFLCAEAARDVRALLRLFALLGLWCFLPFSLARLHCAGHLGAAGLFSAHFGALALLGGVAAAVVLAAHPMAP